MAWFQSLPVYTCTMVPGNTRKWPGAGISVTISEKTMVDFQGIKYAEPSSIIIFLPSTVITII